VLNLPLAQVQERLQQVRNNHTARGAIDIAMHDAIAHSQGLSLAQHLGAPRERVRVSYILGIGERDAVIAEAIGVAEQGVRVLKVKVGRDWGADIAQIDALRDALRDAHLESVEMYADANETMRFADAASRLAALRERGLLYCEEPLPVEQILERSALRSREILPLLGDDSAFTLRDVQRELALNTFDILNIKTPRTGYTESLAMLQECVAANKGIMVGSQASAGLGTARAAIFAARAEVEYPSELSFPLKLRADIVDGPLPIRDGWLNIADALAVQVDAALLREMQTRE
jgi:L-alanine-DL-glutamate epimerase-like enolase superfamily enzyme